ncbi:unnamed protein product [Hydatigera taeniaeformis]|uniref:Glycogen [starch] synthase n=1 Tax=Hydatigena taeniaeformis TaxID=6205 RepID=A0A3P7EVR4_HYDTA|nr:unnamed protein product [Hydatigera taeniaeformis]
MKRCIYAAQRNNLPPICTHNVVQDNIDLVLCNLRRCRLFNNRYDRVKNYLDIELDDYLREE